MTRRGFTLIELLVVIAVIALLIAILLPALGAARRSGRTVLCLSNLRQLAHGWHLYADANQDVLVPGRAPNLPGGESNPDNWYDVGNGLKFRPTWIARMGQYVGIYAFAEPRTDDGRQDFDSRVYVCPEAAERADERNAAYGYNYQFLGNSRMTSGRFNHFPVRRSRIQLFAGTVLGADAMGTAAAVPERERLPYENDGRSETAVGNEGFNLDPPRLTDTSDIASEGHRAAVEPRHLNRVVALFTDGHADSHTPADLGYGLRPDGSYVERTEGSIVVTNRLFSGTGVDDDPPDLPN